jgi:hypothetical protein
LDDNKLYRELNEATATERWLEGLDFTVKRVLIGDAKHDDHWSMAVSFFHGAECLRDAILKNSGYDLFQREYAMMFLYRHSIELFLKRALGHPTHGHNLERLLNSLVQQVKGGYNIDISHGWFADEIRELSKVDPTAQGFRYSHDIHGNPALTTSYSVDLEDLGKRMGSLYSVFLHMSIARGDFTSNENGT